MNIGSLEFNLNDILGESITVLGIKGSGKTNTAAVLAEEILPHVPMTIIDPEGEYYGLKERYPLLIAGSGKQVEFQVAVERAAALATFAYQNRLSIILDLSNFRKGERHDFLTAYLGALWTVASELRQPHFLLLEEARQFIPQQDRSELRDLLTDYALMGRKRGIGLIIVNQRSSNIAKDVLTQAGILLLHRVAHAADMTIYKDLIPGMSGKEVEASVRSLTIGWRSVPASGSATPRTAASRLVLARHLHRSISSSTRNCSLACVKR
jgi:DNA helicase HerA-like ATPase